MCRGFESLLRRRRCLQVGFSDPTGHAEFICARQCLALVGARETPRRDRPSGRDEPQEAGRAEAAGRVLNPHAPGSPRRVRGMRGAVHAPAHPGEDRRSWRRALCGHPSKHLGCVGVPPPFACARRKVDPFLRRGARASPHEHGRPGRVTRRPTRSRASQHARTRRAACSWSHWDQYPRQTGPHWDLEQASIRRNPRNGEGFRGGRYWARTSDLRLVEAALSQLS